MEVTTLTVEVSFADNTTRNIALAPFNIRSDSVSNFKSNVMQFNANVPTDFQQNFLSNDGASATNISAASITTTTSNVIFAKSAEYANRANTIVEEASENGDS